MKKEWKVVNLKQLLTQILICTANKVARSSLNCLTVKKTFLWWPNRKSSKSEFWTSQCFKTVSSFFPSSRPGPIKSLCAVNHLALRVFNSDFQIVSIIMLFHHTSCCFIFSYSIMTQKNSQAPDSVSCKFKIEESTKPVSGCQFQFCCYY